VSDARRTGLALLLLLGLVLAAHLPALSAGWIWDDDSYVTANPALLAPDGWARIWIPGGTPQYYPLVFSSFRIEYALWGLEPFGYHLVNLALHAVACGLLFFLLRRLGFAVPFLAAAILAVHPMTVESVAWVTERKNTLGLAFALAATLAFVAWRERGGAGRWWASLGLYAAALLAKSMAAAVAPALVMLLLWRRAATPRPLLATVPFFALGLVAGLHTAFLERSLVGAEGGEFALGAPERLLLAARSFLFYPVTFLAPIDLAFIYPRVPIELADPRPWAALLVDLGLLGAALVAWRRGARGGLTLLVIYAAGVFPALGFLNVYPFRYSFVADHFAHFALPALAAGLAWAGWRVTIRLGAVPRRALAALLLGPLAVLSATHATAFRDEETLYRRTLATNPEAWMPASNLAGILLRRAGAAADPESARTLALEAEEWASRAVRISPDQFTAWANLSEAQRLQGRRDEAVAAADRAVELAPGVAGFRWMRARLRELGGDLDGAIEDYRAAAEGPDGERGPSRVGPDARGRRIDLGRILQVAGRDAEAADLWRGMLAAEPSDRPDPTVAGNLALALERVGDLDGSRTAFRLAVARAPDDAFRVRIGPAFVRAHLAEPRDAASVAEAETMAAWLVRRTGGREPISLALLAEALLAKGDRAGAAARLAEARAALAGVPEPARTELATRFDALAARIGP